ncbi:alpha/beta fold hydrolase [Lederbergia wuyishanensis]|uniref:Pimeloyl-ACP methyl ester carboxylesterase n=1 Tax=Lederbergia wuyishanensis TaxID=1347903 RepID=A0ABU0D4B9_9BACI|nr:alpha/beta hydrolase [Lederbergia wuyishanensis]MCJ8008164.1 alpha/beta hydrolase [Lederbergia wuyishanensis]MDQ0343247.1 pimeloyl-ACP methyl ester carboxylesterase [Lederbergia wuyishanensis]
MNNFKDSYIHLLDNRKLSFKSYGDKNENKVIFFHGFGSSASAIHPDTTLLDRNNIHLIAVNRPGYGDTTLNGIYTMEDIADDVNELLENKGIQKVSVIGYSAGGLFSQVFADKYSEKVISLNLVSSAIPLNSKETKKILPSNWKMISYMNQYIPFMSKSFFRKLSRELTNNLEATVQKSINQMVEADKRIVDDTNIKLVITKGAIEAYHNNGYAVYYDALALCKKITLNKLSSNIKVNIWQGGKDNVWTPSTSKYLREKYTNSTMSFLDDEGHLLYLSQWEEILKKSLC